MKHIPTHTVVLILAAIFGGLSVAMGAFAAHGLKHILEPKALGWIDTAAQYEMAHALVLLILGFALKSWPVWSMLKYAAYCFALGILLFSGSLYVMAFTGFKALGMVPPLGGLSLLAGWITLVIAATKQPIIEKPNHD